MCHTSGSKGSQPHNIQACRLELESLLMKECQASEHADTYLHYSQVAPSFTVGRRIICNHGFQWCKMSSKMLIKLN